MEMTHIAVCHLPFGCVTVTSTGNLLSGIHFGKPPAGTDVAGNSITNAAVRQLEEYAAGKRFVFDLPFTLKGTDFQLAVWNALQKIPFGETQSYGETALAAVGRRQAARAAGGAIHRNPLAIVIPCHRVIGADRSLTGFAGGLAIKKHLLDMESAFQKKAVPYVLPL